MPRRRAGKSRRPPASEPFNAGRSSCFTATEGALVKPSSWSGAVKRILCVRLKNWPIDRLRRRLLSVARQRDVSRRVDNCGYAERRPPSPLTGERGGEGDARGVDLARSANS